MLKKTIMPMAWIILAAAFLTQMASAGGHFSFGVFLKPLSGELHWSRGATSLAYSLLWWISAPAAVFMGWLSDRVGPRRVLLFGAVVFSAAFILSSYIQSLWQFYLWFGVLGGIGRATARAPLLSAVFKFFKRNKGIAVGIALSGTGVGTLVFPALARSIISAEDWRTGFFVIGVVIAVILVPTALLFRNPRPGEAESEPAGSSPAAQAMEGHGLLGTPEREWTMPELLKSPGFWTLIATGLACCLSHSLPLAHIVAYASDRGIADFQAASVLGVLGISATIGRLLCGVSSDRFGGRKTVLICIIIQTSMMFFVAFAHGLWAFYAFAVLFGLAYGGVLPQYAVVTRELFGMRRFGTAYGLNSFATSVGMGAGGVVGGYIFDFTGGYFWAFMTSTTLGMIAIVCALRLVLMKGPDSAATAPDDPVPADAATVAP